MSQHKRDYSTLEMVKQLRDMDRQVIHGTDFFRQCADAIERCEMLLVEACAKLEKREVKTLRVPPPLADCSTELRDWYGKYRHRMKESMGKECFNP